MNAGRSMQLKAGAVAALASLAFVVECVAVGRESKRNDVERAKAVDTIRNGQLEILRAIGTMPPLSGTWVQLEDGTARSEWLYQEPMPTWSERARYAAELADTINGRTR